MARIRITYANGTTRDFYNARPLIAQISGLYSLESAENKYVPSTITRIPLSEILSIDEVER